MRALPIIWKRTRSQGAAKRRRRRLVIDTSWAQEMHRLQGDDGSLRVPPEDPGVEANLVYIG